MMKSIKTSLLPAFLKQSLKFSIAATDTKCKSYEDIPGPPQIPIVGSSWKFYPYIGEFSRLHLMKSAPTLYKRYGPIVRQKFGSVNLVHLFDPNDFQTVYNLCHKTNHMRLSFSALKEFRESRPHVYKKIGLLPSQDKEWWESRKNSQKVVSPIKVAKTYTSQDDAIIKEFVEKLIHMGTVNDYIKFAYKLNMELTLMYLFGERKHSFDDPQTKPESIESKILEDVVQFVDETPYFDQAPFYISFPSAHERKLMNDRMLSVEKYTQDQIQKVKLRNDPGDKCIAAEFMRNSTDESVDIGAIIDLLYGGLDTTANVSSNILQELGANNRVQTKVREEARRLLPKGLNSEITKETLNETSYIKAVIKENFRLNPIITAQNRQLTESIELSNYHVPKNTMVLMETYTACRLETNFKNPLEFKPERWLKANDEYEESHPFIVLPFGLGIRTCIARRRAEYLLQIILLRIMSELEVSHSGKTYGRYTPFLLKISEPLSLTFTQK